MPVLYVIGGVVAIGLLVYLVVALLKPELFS
jgi:K+-transporting ATPase KdpF subunit